MALKYFKKSVPTTPLWLNGGIKLIFNTNDRITGYFATESDFFQAELQRFIETKRGGVVEIDQSEYESEYVKKKGIVQPKPPPLMEIRAFTPPDTLAPRTQSQTDLSVVAAETSQQTVPQIPLEPSRNPTPALINYEKPRIGRPPGSKNKKAD